MAATPSPPATSPVAFMSYAHFDDQDGRLTKFRYHLTREVRAQTGRQFEIFQDHDDIGLGEQWRRRLAEGLATSTFLIPILTPSFLTSPYCRDELTTFLEHERRSGRDDLVLPVYYIDCSDFATHADEPTAATLRIVLDRQYFDWRDLRLRPPSHARVQAERARLAAKIREAVRRVVEVPGGDPAPSPPEPATVERPAPASLDTLLDALFDGDPVTSRPAAEQIADRGAEAIPAVVERIRSLTPATVHVVRDLLGRFPDASGPLMIARIEAADQDWHAATRVPECFSPAHASSCADPLVKLLADDYVRIDAVRKAIEALGYMGASGGSISRFLKAKADPWTSDDLYDKYSGYCVEALARIVELQGPGSPQEFYDFSHLEDAVCLIASRGWQSLTYPNVQDILSRCGPHHADRFVRVWLSAPHDVLRSLGAYALGGMGLRRVVSALLDRAADGAEQEQVRRTAVFAAGIIGGEDAVEGLLGLEVSASMARWRFAALALCAEDASDPEQFQAIAQHVLDGSGEEKGWLYRAAGRRGDAGLVDLLRAGLHDAETSVRGDAALALARVAGVDERAVLVRSRDEASTNRERVLATLALLTIGETPGDDPHLDGLREALAAESLLYRSRTRHDVIDTLRASAHPRAAAIADAWEPIYASMSAY